MDRKAFLQRLKGGVFLFDGGIGTQLQDKGLGVGEAPESWNLEHPDWVEKVHRNYVAAGAQALTTNSFGGSGAKLEKAGLGDRVVEVNSRAAAVARKAAGGKALVAGSVGPTGEFLEPLGTMTAEEMKDGFRVQIEALIEGGADIIVIETMTALDEILLAVEAARETGDFPVIGSMTFDPTKVGFRTMMGVDIPTAVKALVDAGVDAVGSNCGNGIENFVAIVKEMRGQTLLPILAEANAGLPELVDGRTVFRETPEMMASRLPEVVEAGATLVGGCCGTTPAHVAEFKRVLEGRK